MALDTSNLLDTLKLLSKEEIEKRMQDTQTTIDSIDYTVEILRRSPAISDKDCNTKVNNALVLRDDLQETRILYQTALESKSF